MTTPTTTPAPLHTPPVPVQAKLAAAWTTFMFLYLYVDYLQLHKPGVIDNLRAGRVFEFDISQGLLTVFLVSVAVTGFMVLLSTALPARANRTLNLVVASLSVPYAMFNAVGESWTWFYAVSIGLEVLVLAYVLRTAWTWPRTSAVATDPRAVDLTRGRAGSARSAAR